MKYRNFTILNYTTLSRSLDHFQPLLCRHTLSTILTYSCHYGNNDGCRSNSDIRFTFLDFNFNHFTLHIPQYMCQMLSFVERLQNRHAKMAASATTSRTTYFSVIISARMSSWPRRLMRHGVMSGCGGGAVSLKCCGNGRGSEGERGMEEQVPGKCNVNMMTGERAELKKLENPN
jgi:hypothetical protein